MPRHILLQWQDYNTTGHGSLQQLLFTIKTFVHISEEENQKQVRTGSWQTSCVSGNVKPTTSKLNHSVELKYDFLFIMLLIVCITNSFHISITPLFKLHLDGLSFVHSDKVMSLTSQLMLQHRWHSSFCSDVCVEKSELLKHTSY